MNYYVYDFKYPFLPRISHYRINSKRRRDVTHTTNNIIDSHNCRSESESDRGRKSGNTKYHIGVKWRYMGAMAVADPAENERGWVVVELDIGGWVKKMIHNGMTTDP